METLGRMALVAMVLSSASSRVAAGQTTAPTGPKKLEIGALKARAILQCAPGVPAGAPIAITVPGTGAHGPEEAMPSSATLDGKDTELFTSIAGALRAAGFHTLQLGKPGIEFHTTWDENAIAYDRDLYQRMTWEDMLGSIEDAIRFLAPERACGAGPVVLVGHSEGSGRILDVAARNPKVRGLVFLGYHGHSLRKMVDFQAYQRPVDLARNDVDADRDGKITRDEAGRWKEFSYPWKDGETSVTIADYERSLRANPQFTAMIDALAATPAYGNGIWDRKDMYAQVAALSVPVIAISGTLDAVTPPAEIHALEAACREARKADCETHLFPGVGHGFSAPRPPRSHPVFDMTMGPVSPEFLTMLTGKLTVWRQRIRPGR